MKRLFIVLVLALYTQVPMVMGDPQIEEKYNVYDRENIFYLNMPVREVYRILGQPDEVLTVKRDPPYKNWDIVTLIYPGIVFRYADFYEDPEIYVIALTGTEYQIGSLKVPDFTMENILEVYGSPRYITQQNEYIYYTYTHPLRGPELIELQFWFNTDGICDEVILINTGFFV